MSGSDDFFKQGQAMLNPGAPDGSTWLDSFGQSIKANLGEFAGQEKPPEVQKWEIDNPGSAFVSSLGAYSVPFMAYDAAWAKAGKEAPALTNWVKGIGNAEKAPILTKGLQEAAKYAPLEGARIALAAGIGDKPLSDTIGNAGMDLGLIGGFGAGFNALKEYGQKRLKLNDLVPGADTSLPAQLQVRAAQEGITNGSISPELVDTVKNRIADFGRAIRLEEVPANAKYVGPLDSGDGGEINRIFGSLKSTQGVDKKKFIAGSSGFESVTDPLTGKVLSGANDQIDNVWKESGLPGTLRENLPYMQYPRFFSTKSPEGAGTFQATVTRNLRNVGDGTWMGQEKNNGLYVMARKVTGAEGKGATGDSWVMFKTDTPGKFLPSHEDWAGKVADKLAWTSAADTEVQPIGAKLYDFTHNLTQRFPLINYLGIKEPVSKLAELGANIAERTGLDKVTGGARQSLGEFFNRYFVPTAHQFSNAPRANWINGMARAVFDEGDRLAHVTMYGEHSLGSKNLYGASLGGAKFDLEGSIKGALDKLEPKDLSDVWKAWNEQWSAGVAQKQFAEGNISQNGLDFLNTMRKNDGEMIQQIRETQKAYGQNLFVPMENHFMISRTWAGDWRVPIYNEADQLIYMAAGKTKAAAERNAQGIVKGADKGWTIKEAIPKDAAGESPIKLSPYLNDMALSRPEYYEAAKLQEQLLRKTQKPNFMEARSGVGGYEGHSAPWSKDDLEGIILGHLKAQNKYLSKLIVNEKFAPDLYRLAAEDPSAFVTLQDRMGDLEGKPGPLAKIQNAVVDKVLSPVLGVNSATKIVAATNKALYTLNLGAGQLAQPIMNLLTFTQTVLPEMAFVLNAVPTRVARYYNVWPMPGADGLIAGQVHALDPLKIFKQSLGEMAKPSAELFKAFERAAGDGVISPRLYEEYLGQNASRVGDLRGALEGPGKFAGWVGELSNVLMTGTEKLSRGNAFTSGYIMGRDFLGLTDDRLYAFAKKFTQRTMYGYGTADRSRVFTTPVGSALGLFKNWMTHYMASMLEYTGEGLMRGNWSPLLWQLAGSGVIGGAAATGPAYLIADQFSKFANNKSLMDNTYDLIGGASKESLLTGSMNPSVSDAVFLGLPTLFGVSLSSSGASPFANPTRDITQMFSFVQLDRMRELAKAMGTAQGVSETTGNNPLSDPTVRDQLSRALMPKSVYRAMAVWEDKALRNLNTGNPQFKDLSLAQRIAYTSGLNPTQVERGYRVADELWQDKAKMDQWVKDAGQSFYNAQKANDRGTMNEIMLRTMKEGVDFSRVMKSASAQYEKENHDLVEGKFRPQDIWAKRNAIGQ